jgi:hypothetical protein
MQLMYIHAAQVRTLHTIYLITKCTMLCLYILHISFAIASRELSSDIAILLFVMLLMHITQSYFWNFTVSHRIKTYGLAVVVGDLVFDSNANTDANTVPTISEQDDNDIDMIDTDTASAAPAEVCNSVIRVLHILQNI